MRRIVTEQSEWRHKLAIVLRLDLELHLMKKLLPLVCLLLTLSACSHQQHYYLSEAPYDLYARKSPLSPIIMTVRPGDTLVSLTRLDKPNGRFVRVRHRHNTGYVQFWGQRYLSSSKQ